MNEKQATHWIEEEAARKKFWAYAKKELGLSEDEVHLALGVDSVKEYAGDKAAAKIALDAYAADITAHRLVSAYAPRDLTHTESPATAWCDVYTEDGTRICITARQGAGVRDIVLTAHTLQQGLVELRKLGLTTNGRYRKPGNSKPTVSAKPQPTAQPAPQPTPQPVAQSAPPAPPQPGGGNGNEGNDNSQFKVESITALVTPKGKRNYAIRGGRMMKHGVTAWPEIAEPQIAAITDYNITNLEIGQPWDVSDWNIQAVGEMEDGNDWPKKVVAFAPLPVAGG